MSDAIIVGAGLAGLAAAAELADRGKRVLILDQEGEQNLGAQAFWSLGGLFFVDSPEQRRLRIRDSRALAWQDWQGTAGFDREDDHWPKRWAEAYVDFAAGEKRSWLRQMGHRVIPVVGWAERGGYGAIGHGNSVPRFHLTWGTGPGVLAPFERRVRAHVATGRIELAFRHRVDTIMVSQGAVVGVSGSQLADDASARGRPSSREVVGSFERRAACVLVASGGIGGNHALVRAAWPERLGTAPEKMVAGVPAHVDGRMVAITQATGARLIHPDRMWHYVEGLRNFDPIWDDHGIRVLPGPSSLWLDAHGRRLPVPLFPGYDTLGTLAHLARSGEWYSWFVLTQSVIRKEFALSGSEQNPDITGKDIRLMLSRITSPEAPGPIEAFKRRGADFVVERDLEALAAGMNRVAGNDLIRADALRDEIEARDREVANPFTKDLQIAGMYNARRYLGDRLVRVAKPHRFLDPAHGPLIAVRLNILTRKTLGGFETDLDGRMLAEGGAPIPGLYGAGEITGFGGGGMHGYRSLEGTFLGGCLFSGRQAGRAIARAV